MTEYIIITIIPIIIIPSLKLVSKNKKAMLGILLKRIKLTGEII